MLCERHANVSKPANMKGNKICMQKNDLKDERYERTVVVVRCQVGVKIETVRKGRLGKNGSVRRRSTIVFM